MIVALQRSSTCQTHHNSRETWLWNFYFLSPALKLMKRYFKTIVCSCLLWFVIKTSCYIVIYLHTLTYPIVFFIVTQFPTNSIWVEVTSRDTSTCFRLLHFSVVNCELLRLQVLRKLSLFILKHPFLMEILVVEILQVTEEIAPNVSLQWSVS